MRVGLLIYGDLDTVSGGYLYDRRLVQHLEQCGDQVGVISLPPCRYLRCLGQNFSPGLVRRLAEMRLDVLLQDELCHPSLFHRNTALRKMAPHPVVSIVHHLRTSEVWSLWKQMIYRQVEARYLCTVDGFIYNSRSTRREVESLTGAFGCPGEDKPHVIAHPAGDQPGARIREEEIRERAHLPGSLKVVFLGNLIPRKGAHTLIEALALVPKDSVQVTFAGRLDADSAYASSVQTLASRLGLGENQVRFAGYLDDDALHHELRGSHVLCVPSSFEGYGIAYLEGMAFGLPAIAGKDGGAKEIVTHAEDGYLVNGHDPAFLASVLSKLALDRGFLEQLGLQARRRAMQHPTWEQSMERVREYLLRYFVR